MSSSLTCQICGERLQVPKDSDGSPIRCPWCGVMHDEPAPARQKAAAARQKATTGKRPRLNENIVAEEKTPPAPPERRKGAPLPEEVYESSHDEDDGLPYGVAGGPRRRCPECDRPMEPDASLCTRCGYNVATGKKPPKRTYEPIERTWDGVLPRAGRVGLFAAGQGLAVCGLIGAIMGGQALTFLFSWVVFTGMTAFLLGTWLRVELSRDSRGKVRLARTWYIFFFAQPPEEVSTHEHQEIVAVVSREAGLPEWFMFFILLIMGVVPGLLWWYFAIHRGTSHVSVCEDHGFTSVDLYRGFSEAVMSDIADALHKATGIPVRFG
jgi:hypothetical protein